jgi:hypothetical protein
MEAVATFPRLINWRILGKNRARHIGLQKVVNDDIPERRFAPKLRAQNRLFAP